MAHPFAPSPKVVLSNLEAFEVHHWPIVRAYAEQLCAIIVTVLNTQAETRGTASNRNGSCAISRPHPQEQ